MMFRQYRAFFFRDANCYVMPIYNNYDVKEANLKIAVTIFKTVEGWGTVQGKLNVQRNHIPRLITFGSGEIVS